MPAFTCIAAILEYNPLSPFLPWHVSAPSLILPPPRSVLHPSPPCLTRVTCVTLSSQDVFPGILIDEQQELFAAMQVGYGA